MTTFFRLLQSDDKATALAAAVGDLREGQPIAGTVFEVAPASFEQIPGSPLAYWVSPYVRSLFGNLPAFEPSAGIVRVGTQTSNDERFVRACWEVDPGRIARSRDATLTHGEWVAFAKGGAFSRYYTQFPLVVLWRNDGEDIKAYNSGSATNPGHWSRNIRSTEYYFLPGLTWAMRSHALGICVMPEGCIFSTNAYGALANHGNLGSILAILASMPVDRLLRMVLERGGYSKYVPGVVQRVPWPGSQLGPEIRRRLDTLALAITNSKQNLDTPNEVSHIFILPALLQAGGSSLMDRSQAWAYRVNTASQEVASREREIDDICFGLYSIEGNDRLAMEEPFELTEQSQPRADGPDDESDIDDESNEELEESSTDVIRLTAGLFSWLTGVVLGRWDVRLATGERASPELPDPFAPLPICSPGMLTVEDGLPLRQAPEGYPLKVAWDGILVDDPGHPDDIVRWVRNVLDLLWGEHADAIEREACDILGVKELRDYFRDPKRFWGDHVKRYSKSRRKAPIYWPLSTPSGAYTLWLYYHRLTDQILYSCVNDFVDPKLKQVAGDTSRLRQKSGRTNAEEKELERLTDLLLGLQDFRAELLRLAAFWKPNLNDGVQITAAPLWKLFQHRPWRAKLKETWEKLEAGDYDWAHLAYSIWPDRIRQKCRADKSLAIAHDLEELYVAPPAQPKKQRGKPKQENIEPPEGWFDDD